MLTAKNISEFFLTLTDPDIGDIVSNLKVQKLVYYAQGFHLAMYSTKLFDDDIKAWEHGPVVEPLYHEYKEYGAKGIPVPTDLDLEMFTKDQSDLLKEVHEVYGQFSAWKLRNMTHSERPWVETPRNGIIKPELMQEYFKDFITKD